MKAFETRREIAAGALAFLFARGLAAREIATCCGVPERTVYRWRSRPTAPHRKPLNKLLTAARRRGFGR